jgi:hypothetical protein
MLRMIRTGALALVLALGVSGCAPQLQQLGNFVQTAATATVPADAVIVARVAFNSAQSLATSYLNLRRCTGSNGPICRDPALTVRIGTAVREGRKARNELAVLMRANPGGSVPVASYTTSVINDLTASYKAATGR